MPSAPRSKSGHKEMHIIHDAKQVTPAPAFSLLFPQSLKDFHFTSSLLCHCACDGVQRNGRVLNLSRAGRGILPVCIKTHSCLKNTQGVVHRRDGPARGHTRSLFLQSGRLGLRTSSTESQTVEKYQLKHVFQKPCGCGDY